MKNTILLILLLILCCFIGCDMAESTLATHYIQPSLTDTTSTTDNATQPTQAPTEAPTEAPHVHTWADKNCTAPKTCTTCGITDGSALGHSYSNGKCTRCYESDPSYEAPSTNNVGNGYTIYATPSGKRYHYDPDCGGKNSAIISWDSASRRGLTPCQKCAV